MEDFTNNLLNNQNFEPGFDNTETQNTPNVERNELIDLGLSKRRTILVGAESGAAPFLTAKSSTLTMHMTLASIGYYIPSYRSRSVTYSYLIGVANGDYFCLNTFISEYPGDVKVTACALYWEICKLTDGKPLGYDTLNLPPKKYLKNLLYNIAPNHPVFEQTKTSKQFKLNTEGFYEIPVSLQDLLEVDLRSASIHTQAAAMQMKSITRTFNTLSRVFTYAEKIKHYIQIMKKDLARLPPLHQKENLIALNNLLKRIK